MKQPPQSRILNPKPVSDGFLVGKNWDDPKLYAAVPLAGSTTKLVIIHEGKQLKVCRNEQAAKTSSPNISEATEADWEDFWNSESDGREFSEDIDISAQPD